MKYLISIIILSAFVGIINDAASAEENLEDWTFLAVEGNISITPVGTVAYIQTSGSEAEEWSRLSKNFPNALGFKATINGNASIGIRKNVGINEAGNRILAEMSLKENNGDKDINFKIRERDDEGNTLKVLATGHPGDWHGIWSLGQNVEVGLARISYHEICFYTPANSAFIIIKLSEKMNDFDSSVQIFASAAAGSSNTLNGTVSNVDIIYSDNLMVFEDALPQKNVVVVPLF